MILSLNSALGKRYKSPSQQVRVVTEHWVGANIFCPACGDELSKFPDNRPVADFFCSNCKEEYELKSRRANFTRKVVDGAYSTMIKRLKSVHNPNLFLLRYDYASYQVRDFLVVPKHFFIPEIIEKRNPLSEKARRSFWVGCNILVQDIPSTGKVFFVNDKNVSSRKSVLDNWQKTLFLREAKKPDEKSWSLAIMRCIDELGKTEFALKDVYGFEHALQLKFPSNRHIKDKIRQQLQFLRNRGYLEFLGKGQYRLR